MPLSVLGPLVVLGIAGVVWLVHALGLSRPVRLDEASALAAYLREFPGESPRNPRVLLADDRRAALIFFGGALGVAQVFGDAAVARRLGPGEGRLEETAAGLRLRTRDFAAPVFAIAIADPARRAEALALARARLAAPLAA